MPSTRICAQCGAEVSGYSAEGLCPQCMLLGGLDLDGDTSGFSQPEIPVPKSEVGRLRYFGDYELLEEIARGGMGVVYKARQITLNRIVAVKMILAGQLANAAALSRFLAEAEAAANLRHPNIVAIYEVGEQGGQHYFSMEYIEGKNLDALVREKPLPAAPAAHYVRLLAEAIQYAHEHGTLHRDLKPSNVLLDSFNVPRITDFGLAKQVEGGSELTLSGQVLGTPSFMPPEQAAGNRAAIGPASDIYSLGAILYHLVTGRPPFVAENVTDTLRLVAEAEPVSPRLLNPGVPRDLETICLKCLEKSPVKRFSTAQALADELACFLRDEPIQTRPVRTPEKFWRWCRRKPALASLAVALFTVFMIGFLSVLMELRRAERAEQLAKEHLHDAYLSQAQAARQTLQAGRRKTILTTVRQAAEIQPSLELRNEAISALALTDLGQPRAWRDFTPTNDWQWEGWPAMDSSLIRYAVGTPAGDLSIRRVADQQESLRLPNAGRFAYKVLFSHDGQYLAVRNLDGTINVWDLERNRIVVKARLSADLVDSLDFSPDSQWIAAGSREKVVHFFALTNRTTGVAEVGDATRTSPILSLRVPLPPSRILFNPAGRRLVVGDDRQWQVWEWEPPRLVCTHAQPSSLIDLAWHPDGRSLVVGGAAGDVSLWDIAGGQLRILRGHETHIRYVSFHPRGDLLASSSWDGSTRLWDAHTGQALLSTEQGFNMRFSHDGERLALHRDTRELGVWPVILNQVFRTLSGTPGARKHLELLDFSPDCASLVWSDDEGITWLDLATGEMRQTKVAGVNRPLFAADGASVVAATDRGFRKWQLLRDPQPNATRFHLGKSEMLFNTNGGFSRAEISSQGQMVLAGNRSWTIVNEKSERRTFGNPGAFGIIDVALSGNQRWVALGQWHGGTFVCDAQTGQALHEWPNERSAIVGFTPDSRWLVTGTGQEYRFWASGSWRPGWRFARQLATDISGPVAFSHDGRLMALASTMRVVRLIELHTGTTVADLVSPTPQSLSRLAFNPDGSLLACSGSEGIQLWDLRALRRELRALHLDWDTPPYPPSKLSLAKVVFHGQIEPPPPPLNIPSRSTATRAQLLDLTDFYNAEPARSWLPDEGQTINLAALPSGVQTLDGVEYDVRGVVQLARIGAFEAKFPNRVDGIPVRQTCRRLHFLHSTHGSVSTNSPNAGRPLARYVVHYRDGGSAEIPIIHRRDVRGWWSPAPDSIAPPPVWTGRNSDGKVVRLYHTAWENPRPDVEVRSLDLVSTLIETAPFVLAITVE